MIMSKEYYYANDIGEKKIIVIEFPPINNVYSVSLWHAPTGEFCGSGKKTYQKLKEYFDHYGMVMDF